MIKPGKYNLPWTKSCYVCGEHNPNGLQQRLRVEDGTVILEYDGRATDAGYKNMLHGGIAMTLLDEVMAWAAIAESGKLCTTAEMTTRWRKPVGAGKPLRAEARITSAKGRLISIESKLIQDGVVVVTATSKHISMASDPDSAVSSDFVESGDSMSATELLS